MVRQSGIVVALATAGVALTLARGARAEDLQPLPPPPPSTAPPFPAPPPGPPQPAPGQRQAEAAAEVRYEPDEPGVRLLSLRGEVPYETFGWYGRGWYGGGWYGMGWAPIYGPVCDQRCAVRMVPGEYHLALARDGGPAIPAGPYAISGPSIIRSHYVDHRGLRVAGLATGIVGTVGGIAMIVASAHSEDVCDANGFCFRDETADGPLLVGGIGVVFGSVLAGTILGLQHDEAHVSVEPLRVSAIGRHEGAAPQGLALSLRY